MYAYHTLYGLMLQQGLLRFTNDLNVRGPRKAPGGVLKAKHVLSETLSLFLSVVNATTSFHFLNSELRRIQTKLLNPPAESSNGRIRMKIELNRLGTTVEASRSGQTTLIQTAQLVHNERRRQYLEKLADFRFIRVSSIQIRM